MIVGLTQMPPYPQKQQPFNSTPIPFFNNGSRDTCPVWIGCDAEFHKSTPHNSLNSFIWDPLRAWLWANFGPLFCLATSTDHSGGVLPPLTFWRSVIPRIPPPSALVATLAPPGLKHPLHPLHDIDSNGLCSPSYLHLCQSPALSGLSPTCRFVPNYFC